MEWKPLVKWLQPRNAWLRAGLWVVVAIVLLTITWRLADRLETLSGYGFEATFRAALP